MVCYGLEKPDARIKRRRVVASAWIIGQADVEILLKNLLECFDKLSMNGKFLR